jgi:hypothetical protein
MLALLLGGIVACASTDSPLPAPAPTATTSSPTGSPEPSTKSDESNEGIIPGEIVAAWKTTGGDATLAYRFLSDGRYRFAALLTQPVPEGIFELTRVESGTATVDGDVLTLHPTTATTTRRHPGDPDGDYTDRPEPLTAKRYSWRLDHGVLALVDDTGLELTFDRQP